MCLEGSCVLSGKGDDFFLRLAHTRMVESQGLVCVLLSGLSVVTAHQLPQPLFGDALGLGDEVVGYVAEEGRVVFDEAPQDLLVVFWGLQGGDLRDFPLLEGLLGPSHHCLHEYEAALALWW